MAEIIVSTENLTKQYHKINALNDFHMEVHRGDIYGFVGKNGAGKTTLLRILTGRARQTSGKIELFGKSYRKDLDIQRGKVGAIIETPALYPGMTAKDNLEVLRLQLGIAGNDCIVNPLKMVGLEEVSSKKVKDFSLGMKQRLGLAMALFGNRELLVLDEPVNGLDPEGIVAFREILKKLNVEFGITILISSHFLGELSQIATYYGFIHAGRMMEEISAKELQKKCESYLVIRVDDAIKTAAILGKALPEYKTEIITENKLYVYNFSGETGIIIKTLVNEDIIVKELKAYNDGLENYYMTAIKKKGIR